MASEVRHKGVITAIDGLEITIKFEPGDSAEGCTGCKLAVVCGKSDEGELVERIVVPNPEDFYIGQGVSVRATDPTAWRALLIGIVLPCALMLSTVMVLLMLGAGEAVSAMAGIGLLVPYYLLVYANRQKLAGGLKWVVKPII